MKYFVFKSLEEAQSVIDEIDAASTGLQKRKLIDPETDETFALVESLPDGRFGIIANGVTEKKIKQPTADYPDE